MNDSHHLLRMHCGHHRCGTVWFHNIFRLISEHLQLRYHRGDQAGLPTGADIFFEDHSRIDKSDLPPFRGSHIRRDPRDLIISAFHYHLWSEEPWLHAVREKLGGRTYQQHLRSLDPEDGLIFEMERSSHHNITMMLDWDYRDDRVLEVAYEDLIADEEAMFDRLFRHYRFEGDDHKKALELALSQSFKNVAKRSIGDVKEGAHMRSGASGQWREVFTQHHIAKFKDLFGEGFGDLGYTWN